MASSNLWNLTYSSSSLTPFFSEHILKMTTDFQLINRRTMNVYKWLTVCEADLWRGEEKYSFNWEDLFSLVHFKHLYKVGSVSRNSGYEFVRTVFFNPGQVPLPCVFSMFPAWFKGMDDTNASLGIKVCATLNVSQVCWSWETYDTRTHTGLESWSNEWTWSISAPTTS